MIEGSWGMGSVIGAGLHRVECQRSQPTRNTDAKGEYLIVQSCRLPQYLPCLDIYFLLQLDQRAVAQCLKG